jgi:hypothetical protein
VDTLVGRLAARLGEHLLRGIDADDRRRRETLGQDAADVAGAAAEIVDRVAWPGAVGRIETAHEVERGPQARVGKFEIEVGVPDRGFHVVHGHFSSNAASTGTR